jgi:hypothetical protein
VSIERWPVHSLLACAACPGGVSAAVAEAGLVADEDFAGAEGVSGHRVGGWVIHFPAVVCTSSPSTTTSVCPWSTKQLLVQPGATASR